MDTKQAISAIEDLLTAIYGENWYKDPNLAATPFRVVRMYNELLLYEEKQKRVDAVFDELSKQFPSKHDSLIFATGIKSFSMCPHHFLPVSYTMTIAYIPKKDNGFVVGASKLERAVRILSARAVLQEDLTNDIADNIENFLNPQGVAVLVSGEHDCMRVRGVKSCGKFETSEMRGSFKDNPETRMEFFQLLNNTRR